jgi:hypothetical protein
MQPLILAWVNALVSVGFGFIIGWAARGYFRG